MPDRRMAVLMILILAAAVGSFFALFERYEESVDHGSSADATRNPYLAAELFLRSATDGPVESHVSWDQLGDFEGLGTLVLSDTGLVLSHVQVERLLEWIRAGGDLIVGVPIQSEAEEATDRLLQRFEVSNRPAAGEEQADLRPFSEILRGLNSELAADQDEASKHDESAPVAMVTELTFDGDDQTLQLRFSQARVLHHPTFDESEDSEDETVEEPAEDDPDAIPAPNAWVGSDAGVHLLQFALGEGRVTFLSDAEVWSSSRIGEVDHAYLLLKLVDDGRIAILHGRNVIGVMKWLRQNALQPLLGLFVTVIAWLWYRGRRFGPLRGDLPVASRSLVEQLAAQSEYLWRTGHQHVLIQTMREEVAKRARRVKPDFPRLSEAARLALLSRLTGVEESSLRSAMLGATPADEQAFLDLARQLQRLRKAS